jgi:hypothetical protein
LHQPLTIRRAKWYGMSPKWILILGLIVSVLFSSCVAPHRQSLTKRVDTVSSSLNSVEKRHPGAVDREHIVVTLTPQSATTPTLRYLNFISKPYNKLALPGQSVAQVLRHEFGTDRSDLGDIVQSLNVDLFRVLGERSRDPINVGLTKPTLLVLPNIPLLTQTVTLDMFGESDLNALILRYYPSVTAKLSRDIRIHNPRVIDPRDVLYGKVILPDVPVSRIIPLKEGTALQVQGSSSLLGYAITVASVQSQRGAFVKPSFKAVIETPVDPALDEDIGCVASDSASWFLDQIRTKDVKDSDVKFTSRTRVAVIDSGIDTDHPAFNGILQQLEPDESLDYDPYSGQKMGVDVTDLSKIYPTDTNAKSHGTHVSGLVAGISILNIANRLSTLQLLPIKITTGNDMEGVETSYFHIGEALKVGRSRAKARIFNLSFSAPRNQTIQDAFTVEMTPDLYVVAAGNGKEVNKDEYEKVDLDLSEDSFPGFVGGRQLRGEVLIVAATLRSGKIAPFSGFGRQKVQIAAPGACILSTVRHDEGKNGYAFRSGTSQAAPFVTFTAALLAAKQSDFSADAIKRRLLSTCDWEPLARPFVKNGCELNMAKALATTTDLVELKSPSMQRIPAYPDAQGSVDESVCPREPGATDSGPHPGRLLRGDVQTGKFSLARSHESDVSLPVDQRLRRIWFGDNESQQTVLFGSKLVCGVIKEDTVAVTLEGGMTCPYKKSLTGDCLVPLHEVRDIVFRKPVAE